jgi:hypothetical protein
MFPHHGVPYPDMRYQIIVFFRATIPETSLKHHISRVMKGVEHYDGEKDSGSKEEG